MRHKEDLRHRSRTGEMRVTSAADDSRSGNPFHYMASHEGVCVSFFTLKLWREFLWAVSWQGSSPIARVIHIEYTHTHALPVNLRQPRLSRNTRKKRRGEKKERTKKTGSQCMCVTVSEPTVRHNYGRLVKPHWETSWPRDNDLWDTCSHTSHAHTRLS